MFFYPDIDPEFIHSIIIRCPNWIGDAVMATPFLQEVRAIFSNARIIGTSHPAIASLYQHSPFFDDFIPVSRVKAEKKASNKQFITTVRNLRPDLGILLTNSFSSAWLFRRAHIPLRLGLEGHIRRFLLTHSVKDKGPSCTTGIELKETRHDVQTYRLMLNRIHKKTPYEKCPPLVLKVSEEETQNMQRHLETTYDTFAAHHRIIIVNPGAAYGSAKCWPPSSFRSLIERLIDEPKNRVFVTGDQSMIQMVDDIVLRLPPRVYNVAGKTSLRELMSLISLSDGVVSNDSGPMHIASAFQRPLVALFGSTNPYRTGPFNGGEVLYKEVFCSPCYRRICPIDFRCMTTISVDEVYESLMKVLGV